MFSLFVEVMRVLCHVLCCWMLSCHQGWDRERAMASICQSNLLAPSSAFPKTVKMDFKKKIIWRKSPQSYSLPTQTCPNSYHQINAENSLKLCSGKVLLTFFSLQPRFYSCTRLSKTKVRDHQQPTAESKSLPVLWLAQGHVNSHFWGQTVVILDSECLAFRLKWKAHAYK